MNDHWRENGQEITAIDNLRRMVLEFIIDVVKDDSNQHEFAFVDLADPKKTKPFELLTVASRGGFDDYIRNLKAQPYHFDLFDGLTEAKSLFEKDALDKSKNINPVLHVVSDFREADWNASNQDKLGEIFEFFKLGKVEVKLHDVASPLRDAGDKPVKSSNNLAIIDFRPESRVVVKDMPVEFTVTVANYGDLDAPNVFVRVRVNNDHKQDADVNIDRLPPQSTATVRTTFALSRTAPKDVNAFKDGIRKFDGFNLVSASIDPEPEGGLLIDNVRYAYVEVREKLPILLVDNNIAARGTKNSESFYLWKLFTDTYRGFDVQIKSVPELEKLSLQNYSAIMLCDIPTMPDPIVKKLESYVAGGGGVGFFMGQSIRDPKFYNEKLWKGGKGMFPVPLLEIANKSATTEEELIKITNRDIYYPNKKLLVRKESRRLPALERLYADSRGQSVKDDQYEKLFYGVAFARYYVVDRPKVVASDNVQNLIYLYKNEPVSTYEGETLRLLNKLRDATNEKVRRELLSKQLIEAPDDRKPVIQKRLDSLKEEMDKFVTTISLSSSITTSASRGS